jgi:hypothetical protein
VLLTGIGGLAMHDDPWWRSGVPASLLPRPVNWWQAGAFGGGASPDRRSF